MVANTGMLDINGVKQYIGQHAAQYNLDPAALIAVANGEGLGTRPGATWTVPGEPLPSFGPPSWYAGGAGADFMKHFGVSTAAEASAIAWSPAGLDYWMQQAAATPGVAGTSGVQAITNLVTNFERPASQYVSGNISNAIGIYDGIRQQIASLVGQIIPIPIPGDPPIGNPIVPVPTEPGGVVPAPAVTIPSTPAGSIHDVKLGSIGPLPVSIPSGLVLGLFGMGLLALGVVFFVAQGKLNLGTSPFSKGDLGFKAGYKQGISDYGPRSYGHSYGP